MSTPVLTKSQQKATLSAKKLKKATIKNVLVSPFKDYWPLLSPEDNLKIIDCLKGLEGTQVSPIQVPWSELKLIPRDDRKKFRADYRKKFSNCNSTSEERRHMIFGINNIAKGLETKTISAVLIASDTQPRFLVKHIIDSCTVNEVPVLVVQDLRNTLVKVCGFASAIFGIKNTIESHGKLNILSQTIQSMWKDYPSPKKQNGPLKMEYDSILVDMHENVERKTGRDAEMKCKNETEGKDVDGKGTLENTTRPIYLYKTSATEAAFTPRCSISCSENGDLLQLDVTDKWKVSHETPRTTSNQNSFAPRKMKQSNGHGNGASYKALIVKRLKGDSNRNKRKANAIKQKR